MSENRDQDTHRVPDDTSPHGSDDSATLHRVPMQALHERIDEVRANRPLLATQIRRVAQEVNGSWSRKSLDRLADAIDQSVPTPQIVSRFPNHCWLLTLGSSEATTDGLTSILEQTAHQQSLRSDRIQAVAYPLVMLGVAIVLLTTAAAFLIPPFDAMYREFGIRLPAPTQWLLDTSRFVIAHPYLVAVLSSVALVFFGVLLWLFVDGKLSFSVTASQAGQSSRLRQMLSKVSLQLAELCEEGIELNRALSIAAESTPQPKFRRILADLATSAHSPDSQLCYARSANLLPPNLIYALQPSGNSIQSCPQEQPNVPAPNTALLRQLAANYMDLSQGSREWVALITGQLGIVMVGLTVMFVVIALFMPMLSLVQGLSG